MTTLTEAKPEYRIPSMEEIRSVPWNGYKVISTFSGAGGSCLGFRMAGYRVLWANEFIPEAREVYKANHPNSILASDDIRQINPEKMLEDLGIKKGEIDVLEGSPPCASFSSSGNLDEDWGKEKKYSSTVQRTDDLFWEYARLLNGLQPKVFVAENVSGLVRGKAKGYFKLIMKELKKCGYRVQAKLLDAQWLGIPQVRKRVIFVGVRNDLKMDPVFPKPLPYRYLIKEVFDYMTMAKVSGKWQGTDRPSPTVSASTSYNPETSTQGFELAECDISRYAIGEEWSNIKEGEYSKKYFNLKKIDRNKPSYTITHTAGYVGAAGVVHHLEKRKLTIDEVRILCSFPKDFILIGTYQQKWERLGRSVPPLMMKAIAEAIRKGILDKLNE